jgi:pyruvate dehydrogenase (quinone)
MSKRVADLLVETLQTGVKTCYGIVGDTMNQIAHAISRSEHCGSTDELAAA